MSQYKHKEKIGYEKFLDDFLKSEISYESIEKQNWRFDNKNILWDAGDKFQLLNLSSINSLNLLELS